MYPYPLVGLALLGRTLQEYSKFSINKKYGKRSAPCPMFLPRPLLVPPRPVTHKAAGSAGTATVPNPLQTLVKGLSSTLSQVAKNVQATTRKPSTEDYEAIVKSFIPAEATLLTPEHPSNSRAIQLADLDGDSQNELIVSYKLNDEILTTILKKGDGSWYKAGETSIPGYDTVNYRGVDSLAGQGTRQLLMGFASKGKTPVLHGYEFGEDGFNKIFTRNYRWFELVKPPKDVRNSSGTHLALWNETGKDTYDIEVLHWDGLQLEPQNDTSSYYGRSVVPYYVRKVRQNPDNVSNWYNLADALAKAGAYRDASIAVEVGMRLDTNSEYKDQFTELMNKIAPEK